LAARDQEEVGLVYKDEGRKSSLIASLQAKPYPDLKKKLPHHSHLPFAGGWTGRGKRGWSSSYQLDAKSF
jgi:hypothetical protein